MILIEPKISLQQIILIRLSWKNVFLMATLYVLAQYSFASSSSSSSSLLFLFCTHFILEALIPTSISLPLWFVLSFAICRLTIALHLHKRIGAFGCSNLNWNEVHCRTRSKIVRITKHSQCGWFVVLCCVCLNSISISPFYGEQTTVRLFALYVCTYMENLLLLRFAVFIFFSFCVFLDFW